MKPSPSVNSSDLERARATAGRLIAVGPGEAPAAPPEKPRDYVRFSAQALGVAASAAPVPRPPAPAPAPPSPRPAPLPPVAAPPPPVARVLAPEPKAPPKPEPLPVPKAAVPPPPPPPPPPTPPVRAAAPPRPTPPPPPPPPPPEPPAPMGEPVFEIEESQGLEEPGDEHLGVMDDDEPKAPEPAAPAESSMEFDEDIAEIAAAAVPEHDEEATAEPAAAAPTWAEILDDAIYLAHARCALVMDGAGQIRESRGDWPKNTLDKVAARLLRGIEQTPRGEPRGHPDHRDPTGFVLADRRQGAPRGQPRDRGLLEPGPDQARGAPRHRGRGQAGHAPLGLVWPRPMGVVEALVLRSRRSSASAQVQERKPTIPQ